MRARSLFSDGRACCTVITRTQALQGLVQAVAVRQCWIPLQNLAPCHGPREATTNQNRATLPHAASLRNSPFGPEKGTTRWK